MTNSLIDIKAKRVTVLKTAKDLGVDAVEALADRFLDGIVLEVTAQAFTDDGTLAPAGAREELTELGMVEVRVVLPPPPETSIPGFPILPEPDWSGSTIQETNEESALFQTLNESPTAIRASSEAPPSRAIVTRSSPTPNPTGWLRPGKSLRPPAWMRRTGG